MLKFLLVLLTSLTFLFADDAQLIFHPVTTTNSDAQAAFNEGLLYIYGFNQEAAFRSFKRAKDLDPKLAMAEWGMALSFGPNINSDLNEIDISQAYSHIQNALKIINEQQISKNEQDYIYALSKRYRSDKTIDGEGYMHAMESLAANYPDDLDAQTLFAESLMVLHPWDLWNNDKSPKPGTQQIIDALRYVLKRNPDHIGANHYYIHAVEQSAYPEVALVSADKLQRLLSSSSHLLHMPSHIYILVGDYHTAALVNENAIQSDYAYIRKYGSSENQLLSYLGHNLAMLCYAYSMEGNFEKTKKNALILQDFAKEHLGNIPFLQHDLARLYIYYLHFEKWSELLTLPEPTIPRALLYWHLGRSISYAKLGDPEKAIFEKNKFSDLMIKNTKNSAIALSLMDAFIADSKGNPLQAIDYLKKAVAEQDEYLDSEPPLWYPLREALGSFYLKIKHYNEAESVFREDLQAHPRNGRSLFGLYQALKNLQRDTDALWIYEEFKKAWQYADTNLEVEENFPPKSN